MMENGRLIFVDLWQELLNVKTLVGKNCRSLMWGEILKKSTSNTEASFSRQGIGEAIPRCCGKRNCWAHR